MFNRFAHAAAVALGSAVLAVAGAAVPSDAQAQRYGQERAPRGSYQQSCSNAQVSGGRLYAGCRDVRRNTRTSSIDLARCGQGDIANDNGLLVCPGVRGEFERESGGGGNGGGWNGGGWNGGGRRGSITLYRDSNFRGEQATFDGEIYNLSSTGLNDAVSSMEMRGVWEACSDSNFRGTCQIFEGDVRNLADWSLNDRISSIRPVRRGDR